MSFAYTHKARPLLLLLLRGTGAVLCSACGADAASDFPGGPGPGGGHLGDGALPFPDAGALLDAGGPPSSDDPNRKRARLMHAIANAGPLQLCYDADRTVGLGHTAPDATLVGPMPPTLLAELAEFGQVQEVPDLGPLPSGALTLHHVVAAAADAGVSSDGGAALTPCAEDTLEAALLLASAEAAPDAGADAGFPGLRMGGRVSLFATGVALDDARLEARLSAVRERHLEEHPGDQAGADQAARKAREALLKSVGPQLSESEEPRPPSDGSFRLSVAHLVPDVPSTGSTNPGGLRLCVTADTLVNPVSPPLTAPAVGFRERQVLAGPFSSNLPYRFRVFAASAFDAAGQDCALASVKPLAQLEVSRARFRAGRTYTLAFVGALTPNSLCTPVDPESLAQASCTQPVESLAAQLLILDD